MKRNRFCAIGMVLLLLSGCSLLPEEEELRTAPVVSAYEAEEYKYVLVTQGDMILKEDMVCFYEPTQEESLSFAVGGEYYGTVYVKAGDTVKKGDLLAELDMADVKASIEDSRMVIRKLELQSHHIDKLMALEYKRARLLGEDSGKSSAILQYQDQKKQIADSLYIARERLNEKEDMKRQRQIYAGIDGVVASIRVVKEGDRSVEGEEFIKIMSGGLSFTGKTKNWSLLSIGQKANITVGDTVVETTVASIEDDQGGYKVIKFSLGEVAVNFPQGTRGSFTLILEERKNVLMVPNKAITKAGDKTFVYCFDENGLKTVKTVEIGLKADGMVEIISGLEKGEQVILGGVVK